MSSNQDLHTKKSQTAKKRMVLTSEKCFQTGHIVKQTRRKRSNVVGLERLKNERVKRDKQKSKEVKNERLA